MYVENRVLREVLMLEIETDFRKTERRVKEILLLRWKVGISCVKYYYYYIYNIIHCRFLRTYAEYNASTIK